MKRVLMIAFHFPPMLGSSGLQRTLKFCKYLPQAGWQPTILTATPGAYPDRSDDLLSAIPSGTRVERALALDAARHLSIRGRYPFCFALPDRWASWVVAGLVRARQLIAAERPQVVWSTYPIATAHLIAYYATLGSDIPWVMDVRDPMVEDDYPEEAIRRATLSWLERKSVGRAAAITATAPGTIEMYRRRYPLAPGEFEFLPNGYDEEDFDIVAREAGSTSAVAPVKKEVISLLHSGIVYLEERDPRELFEALSLLRRRIESRKLRLQVKFRACRNEEALGRLVNQYSLADVVSLLPPLPYKDALYEMHEADGLLLLQGATCNHQIPAKIFEYMRVGKPILALTDPTGDTAKVLRDSQCRYIAPLDDVAAIEALIGRFVEDLAVGELHGTPSEVARQYRRQEQANRLASLFERVCVA